MIEPETLVGILRGNAQKTDKSLCTQPKHEPYDLMIVWDGSVMAQVGKVTVIRDVTYHDIIPVPSVNEKVMAYVKNGLPSYISDKHILYFGPYEKAFDKRYKVQETRKENTDDTV